MDFAQNELLLEHFAVRFKLEDAAHIFYSKFVECQSALKVSVPKSSNIIPSANQSISAKKEVDDDEPKEEEEKDANQNIKPSAGKSDVLDEPNSSVNEGDRIDLKPVGRLSQEALLVQTGGKDEEMLYLGDHQFSPQPGSWSCESCYANNQAESIICVSCEMVKSAAESTTGMSFSLLARQAPHSAFNTANKVNFLL